MRRIVLVAALAAAACDQPPVKEITAAEQQVERARLARADRYAPERMKQAQDALVAARQRLQERDYRSALSAANDAAESARMAVEATGPAKAAARTRAEAAIAEVRRLLDRATVERTAAVKAGVLKVSLAALDAQSDQTAQSLAAVEKQLATGDPDVEAALAGLSTAATSLPDGYRLARTQGEAKHAKARPRGRRH